MEKQTIFLLLFIKKGKPFFIASQPEFAEKTIRSSLPETVLRLKEKILEFYKKFKERFDPQENVCSVLRFSDRITIVHQESIPAAEAAKIFKNFLARSGKKHTVWMVLDSILALMGGILTPLPGPNLFFFYPAARAVSHYFARKGISTAKAINKKDFTVNFLLDTIQENLTNLETVENEIDKLEESFKCTHIMHLLRLP